jgi:hypothetical protein
MGVVVRYIMGAAHRERFSPEEAPEIVSLEFNAKPGCPRPIPLRDRRRSVASAKIDNLTDPSQLARP